MKLKPGIYSIVGSYFRGTRSNQFSAWFTILEPGDVPIVHNTITDLNGYDFFDTVDIREDGFSFAKRHDGQLQKTVWTFRQVDGGSEGYYIGESKSPDGTYSVGLINAFVKELPSNFFDPSFARFSEVSSVH